MSKTGQLTTDSRPVAEIKALLPPDDPHLKVINRAEQAGIEVEWATSFDEDQQENVPYLIVKIPNGRKKRSIILDNADAEKFLTSGFENVRFLGRYEAVQFIDTGMIEANLRVPNASTTLLQRLPGAELIDKSSSDRKGQPVRNDGGTRSRPWRLRFGSSPGISWTAEIGSQTDRFRALRTGYYTHTLKINGISSPHHDDTVRALETAANAILFEIDLRYGFLVMLSISRASVGPIRLRRDKLPTQPPTLPRFKYQSDSISLYFYARSAQGMPLLQYLAYYQVLEYYFPSYARRELLERLRNQLKDATFSAEEDAHLSRLIAIVHRYGQGYGNEGEQLKATIRACVEEDDLRLFVTGNEKVERYFTGPKIIKGLSQLKLNDRTYDMRDQVAARIYDLRCRIVHTKDESTDLAPGLLLPFSAEADSILLDIELLEFLAQKVLSANAQPMRL